ncbi:MAG: hypothetical protein ACJA1S_000489 [Cellvibrionaceae bacterium]|jgi:uncharacterized protein YjfI (DUF2170 family)
MTNIAELASKLNGVETKTGDMLQASVFEDNDGIKVTSALDPNAAVSIIATDEQFITITPLFKLSDVKDNMQLELSQYLLKLSLILPLSALALQDNQVVLFGKFSVNTVFDNIVEEIDTQLDSYSDVLASLSDFIKV